MIKKKDKILEVYYYVCCLLFLFTMVWEIPHAVFWGPTFAFGAFCIYRFYTRNTMIFENAAGFLLVFCVSYCASVYNTKQSLVYQTYIFAHAFFMYYIGVNAFPEKNKETKRKLLEAFFFIVSLMYVIYMIATLLNFHFNHAHDLEAHRMFYSLWYGKYTIKPCTVILMSLVIPLTYGLYAVLFQPIVYKIFGIGFIGLTMWFSVWSGARTLVFAFPFLLVGTIFAYLWFVKKNHKAALITAGSIVGICAVAVVLILVFKDNLTERFGDTIFIRILNMGLDSPRWQANWEVIKDFSLTYMGGGEHSAKYGTPHNIWLYIYDHGGIIPFVFFCIFTIIIIKNCILMLFSKKVETRLKFLIFIMFSMIVLEYNLEPFIYPLPSFFCISMFIMGVITSEARRDTDKKRGKVVKIEFSR